MAASSGKKIKVVDPYTMAYLYMNHPSHYRGCYTNGSSYQWIDSATIPSGYTYVNTVSSEGSCRGVLSLQKPSLSTSSYVETGSLITPTINGFDSNTMTKTGDLSAKNPGSYTIRISLRDPSNYKWSDGSTGDVLLTWKITSRTKVARPTINPTVYTETGGTIHPTISGYDSSIMTMNGATSGVSPGNYTVTFSLKDPTNYAWSDGSTSSYSITWTIKSRTKVTRPTISPTSYMETGSSITPTINGFDSSIMNKSGGTSGISPGSYTITFSLKDPNNYSWSDGTNGSFSATWTIKARTKLTKPSLTQTSYVETGSSITPTINGFNSSTMNKYGDLSAKNPGSYTITISLRDPANYTWSDGSTGNVTLTWKITSRTKVTRPSINPLTYTETGSSITPTIVGFDSSVMNKSGSTSGISPGNYTVTFSLKDPNNYSWSDGTNGSFSTTWTIKARTRLNRPTLSQTTYMETGGTITPNISGYNPNTMTMNGATSGKNPGNYTITFTLKDPTNYAWSDGTTGSYSITWTIKARTKVTKPIINPTSYVETGGYISPNINGYSSGLMNMSGPSSAREPGSYTITFSLKDPTNYVWSDGSTGSYSITWKITPKTRLQKPTLPTGTYVQTGGTITPSVDNFDSNTMAKVGDVSAISPGNYSLIIVLKDTANYAWSDGSTGQVTLSWTIVPSQATVTVNKPTLQNSTFMETGSDITPTINGFDPNIMTKTGTTTAKNPGTYQITFGLKNKNSYKWRDGSTANFTVTWKINARTRLDKPTLSTTSFAETGEDITPLIEGFDESTMTKTGNLSAKDPGTYTITIAIKDKPNYAWSDGTTTNLTLSWEITKVITKLTKPTLSTSTYETTGEDITPTIEGFDENTMTKSGDLTAKDPGTYTITIALKNKEDYAWNDDTTTDLTITWNITEKIPEEEKGTLVFTVVDQKSSKPVAKALVEVHKKETDKLVYSGKTDNKGKLVVEGLVYGAYYIVEKEVPKGYVLSAEKMAFTIDEDNKQVNVQMKNKSTLENPDTAKLSYIGIPILCAVLFIITLIALHYKKRKFYNLK